MAGLGKIAAPPKFLCCEREWFLHSRSLRGQKPTLSAPYHFEPNAANSSYVGDQSLAQGAANGSNDVGFSDAPREV